jgi:ATP-dependent DNA helicase RecG
MTTQEMIEALIADPKSFEHECLEWKTASSDFNFDDIGKYFSALSNEANLANKQTAHLIFGLSNDIKLLGTQYRQNKGRKLSNLNHEIADQTNGRISFSGIDELKIQTKRVLVFSVPPAPAGIPTAWKGHYYAREGESLVALSLEKLERIRLQNQADWSVLPCVNTGIVDLDVDAISYLRKKLAEVKQDKKWLSCSSESLLGSLGLLTNKVPNNTCLLFLGKREVADRFFLDRNKISWKYTDSKNSIEERLKLIEQKSPLILVLDKIVTNINRFNHVLQDFDLFRSEIEQYDKKSIEELLVNAIAHRDWKINFWIEVLQTPDGLEFRNPGIFRADLNAVLAHNQSVPYLNPCMSEFLQHLNLMEKERGGLQKVYEAQLRRGVSVQKIERGNRVDFILEGQVKNKDFAKLVLQQSDITLDDLLLLDKIVSGKNIVGKDISKEEKKKLVEHGYIKISGRSTQRCFVSSKLSKSIGRSGLDVRSDLSKNRVKGDIIKHINKHGSIKLKDLRSAYPEFSEWQLKNILSKELHREERAIKLIKGGSWKDWHYVLNDGIAEKRHIK